MVLQFIHKDGRSIFHKIEVRGLCKFVQQYTENNKPLSNGYNTEAETYINMRHGSLQVFLYTAKCLRDRMASSFLR